MTTIGGQILRLQSGQTVEIAPGVVRLEGDRIAAVDFERSPSSADLGSDNTLISPGFVDTHLHLPQFDSMGATGMPLLRWLSSVIFPAELRWNDLEFATGMIRRVIDQCLAVGTTGICAYASVSHAATMAALQLFSEAGFRGVIGQVIMDRAAPKALTRDAAQLLDEVQRTLEEFPPNARLAAAVTPRFALSCHKSLLRNAGELAQQSGAIVQTHLAETRAECDLVESKCSVERYVDVYRDAQLLGPRSLLGHGIHLDATSQRILAESGSVIVHCPTANAFLGSGTMNRRSHLDQGIRISLGSDIGAGYERSMVRVGRAMIDAAMRIALAGDEGEGEASPDSAPFDEPQRIPTAADAWYQITAGNAAVLGWSDGGQIVPGFSADLVVIEPDIPWRESVDPLSTVMFAWDDRWIRHTLLRGKVVYSAGQAS